MFGEIHLCEFPFTSGATTKTRPALVLFDLREDAIICRVTSVLHHSTLDVQLKDWSEAGLLKHSTARLNRIITAERTIFLRKLGDLSARDREAIRTAWNTHMKL
jgi:mRNA interferase MazF